MRVAVLDKEGHVINLIAVENESDIAGFGFHSYRVLAEGEGVDIWEDPENVVKNVETDITEQIHNIAKLRGYDSIDSCTRYVAFPNEWQAECLALLEWNASVWRAFITWSTLRLANDNEPQFTIPTPP